MPSIRILALALLPATLPGAVHAQSSTEWTVDDVLTQQTAGAFEFSPDGRFVAWVKSEMDTDKGRRYSNLWITRLEDGESWPLTRGKDGVGSPRFSPDSRLLAFTSSRAVPDPPEEPAGSQIWLIRTDGGEPWALTRELRGLRQIAWKGGSSDTLVFTAREATTELERVRKKAQDTGIAVEDTIDAPPVRIWSTPVEGGRPRRLTDHRDPVETMALSPDGRRAITRNTRSLSYTFDAKRPPVTHLVDLDTGERRVLDLGVRVSPGSIEWTHDGRGALMSYEYSSHPLYRTATVTRLGYYDIAADSFREIELEWPRGLSSFETVPDGFIATLEDGVRTRIARYRRNGDRWTRSWIEGEHAGRTWGWVASDDGRRIAYAFSAADSPPQPFAASLDGNRIRNPVRLHELNPAFAKKPALRAEVIHWEGAQSDTVEGILYYPIGYREGRRYPLIHSIHGGPTSADRDAWSQSWSAPAILYNQRGAFVLKTNYHGSCCYGLEWVESIGNGRYYELEIPDLEAGADFLIDNGLVHPDSIATAGWSNGAILSSALTVENPGRYKAAIIGAGDVEWISDWGNVDFGASFDNYYFGASPLEDPELYIRKSPYFRLGEVRTPTLLFTGTEDRNVPPSQSWSHYRALQQLGNTEVRLVLFPGEPHGLGKLAHQRRKVEEELRWLDRYLWGRPDTTNLALRDGSPLAGLLAMSGVARSDGLLGLRVNGVLVPEVVARGDLAVGRFEVTRAQWREFDSSYVIPVGTENHPVTGIGLDRAQAYAAWLADRTGRPFRLPTRAEWEGLGAPSAGNTLDHWAGYAPNPDDAERLEAAVSRLNGDAPLLVAAGSFGGDAVGDPAIHDLGGNAAEWVTDASGAGAAVGASAERSRAARTKLAADPDYVGLRVVVAVTADHDRM